MRRKQKLRWKKLEKGRLEMKTVLIFIAIILVLAILAWMFYRAQDRELEEWRLYIADVCKPHNIRPEIVEAIIEYNSNWNPQKIDEHRIGLMQLSEILQKNTMDKLGLHDLSDPYDNIEIGVHQLQYLYERCGDDDITVLMVFRGSNNSERIDKAESTCEWAKAILRRAEQIKESRMV